MQEAGGRHPHASLTADALAPNLRPRAGARRVLDSLDLKFPLPGIPPGANCALAKDGTPCDTDNSLCTHELCMSELAAPHPTRHAHTACTMAPACGVCGGRGGGAPSSTMGPMWAVHASETVLRRSR